jgi:hypothetical protein
MEGMHLKVVHDCEIQELDFSEEFLFLRLFTHNLVLYSLFLMIWVSQFGEKKPDTLSKFNPQPHQINK